MQLTVRAIAAVVLGLISFSSVSALAFECKERTSLTIGMYGDSTIFGTPAANEPEFLLRMLRDTYPCTDFQVRNHGIGGSTASDWYHNDRAVERYVGRNWGQLMADPRLADEKIVIMNVAVNDAYVLDVAPSLYTPRPAVMPLTREQYRDYYRAFAISAQGNGKMFVIAGPNPITSIGHNLLLQELVEDQKTVARERNVLYIDQYWLAAKFVANWPAHLPDGVHPDPKLYMDKAWFTFETLRPVISAFAK